MFQYVEQLQERGEFENLKGLIYFTDGYGIYPERMPDYRVIFAFLDEDENRGPVPPWSMMVILESDVLEDEEEAGRRSDLQQNNCNDENQMDEHLKEGNRKGENP